MPRSLLSKILIILFVVLFLFSSIYIFYQFFINKSDSTGVGTVSSKVENVKALKQSANFTDILEITNVNKNEGFIETKPLSENFSTGDKYKIDENTILVCLESRESLEILIDFSSLDVYSGFFEYDYSFFDSIIGNHTKLKVIGDYVAVMVVGGCN